MIRITISIASVGNRAKNLFRHKAVPERGSFEGSNPPEILK